MLDPVFQSLKPPEARKLLDQEDDLVRFGKMVAIVKRLNMESAPLLYTHDELRTVLEAFRKHWVGNHDSLLEIGLPRSLFASYPWLNDRLNLLLPARIPGGIRSADGSVVPFSLFLKGEGPDLPVDKNGNQLLDYDWGPAGAYENLSYRQGLRKEQGARIEKLRPDLLKLVGKVIREFIQSAERRCAPELWEKCLVHFGRHLGADEIRFLFRFENIIARNCLDDTGEYRYWLEFGGLTDLLSVIREMEFQIQYNTGQKIISALKDFLKSDKHGRHVLVLESYYDCVHLGGKPALDQGLEVFRTFDYVRARHGHQFNDRVKRDLGREFLVSRSVWTPESLSRTRFAEPDGKNSMKREGSNWKIIFRGVEQASVRHKIGMTYITFLLERPGQEFTPIQLLRTVTKGSTRKSCDSARALDSVPKAIRRTLNNFPEGDLWDHLRIHLLPIGKTLCYRAPSTSAWEIK